MLLRIPLLCWPVSLKKCSYIHVKQTGKIHNILILAGGVLMVYRGSGRTFWNISMRLGTVASICVLWRTIVNVFKLVIWSYTNFNWCSVAEWIMKLTSRKKCHYLLTPLCRILFEKLIVTQLVKQMFCFFMEPEGSLQYSQKPATGPYPEPAESSSTHRSVSP